MTAPKEAPRLAFFILLRALPAWLALPREQRRTAWQTDALAQALSDPDRLSTRFFDAEAFTARCSDILLVETRDIDSQNDFMEALRDSPVFAEPYFELVDILPAMEDGFQRYEARRG